VFTQRFHGFIRFGIKGGGQTTLEEETEVAQAGGHYQRWGEPAHHGNLGPDAGEHLGTRRIFHLSIRRRLSLQG
jgi:hypothetical protein